MLKPPPILNPLWSNEEKINKQMETPPPHKTNKQTNPNQKKPSCTVLY